MLIVTLSPRISIARCILLAANFLSNIPDAEIYITSPERLKDIGRQRLIHHEKLVASRFALWSDECCARAISSSASVVIVLDPFEAGVAGPHKELFVSLKYVKRVFLVPSAIDFFRKNARVCDQVCVLFRFDEFT
jgi:hypothetical protein